MAARLKISAAHVASLTTGNDHRERAPIARYWKFMPNYVGGCANDGPDISIEVVLVYRARTCGRLLVGALRVAPQRVQNVERRFLALTWKGTGQRVKCQPDADRERGPTLVTRPHGKANACLSFWE